jgi:RNA polymerase-binding transcription factor DksA
MATAKAYRGKKFTLWAIVIQNMETTRMGLEKNENYFELTDDNDRASAIEAQFNEDALEEARRKIAPETSPDFDGKHCIECGEKIPAARLKLGKIRCIECQSLREQKNKFFGG